MLAGTADVALRCYQILLSPAKSALFGPAAACRFHPTCSEYARQCFTVHPFPRAVYLVLRRLLRCHPFHAGGYDPAPAAGPSVPSQVADPAARP